jgi:uncharacterized protein with PIN domain
MATFQFFGNLNDFLPKKQRGTLITFSFKGNPAVKDSVEALGVPHPEVAGILANGVAVDFRYLLKPDDRIEVFPKGIKDEFSKVTDLQPDLPKEIKFVLDVHLGKLAKNLWLLGFDTVYSNSYHDQEIARIATEENRIVLTRDVNLLKQKVINWGYWLRSQHLEEQLTEVIGYFGLGTQIQPFTRCLECNGQIFPVPKDLVLNILPPNTRLYFEEFYQCQNCQRVFWKGSHYERMEEFIRRFQESSF